MTIRAQRLATPLRIDGQLDEAVYASVPPISDFIQTEPAEGSPANEKTEVWVFFDDEHVYIVGRCWETHPERIVANEMRRDNFGIVQNDNFAWSFDTFFDKRNGVLFEVNPVGGRVDGQITNESQINTDWNPVWDLATGRFDEGWVVEAALPFKSLRYRPGRAQTWGLQVRRRSRWRNEISYRSARISGCAGSISRAASCLSSTTNSVTPWRPAFPSSRIARSSSRSTASFDSERQR